MAHEWGAVLVEAVLEYPSPREKMSIGEMMPDYTISNAKQLCIEKTKGSIEVGRDADFNVFDVDMLTAGSKGISFVKPARQGFMMKKE